ncbi:PhzF family phenazine biosynthesis protein [Alteromonas aestuariivivens]|uniref:PhzF family phenazine biosynthesis protein n=1 Tax=Alteromonas aestuariivivens TaxID=1938339 RepID=A0A3D8M3W7_9ALTE|nr:PhzF family phenazine biosynthesis protein [Alteromonas aestuariivivens]RDV24326.1 PhzF family phenazine biosynthesis protein [Alteromonas aestuariivivens]
MQIQIDVIDAFTHRLFSGNPAAVIITEEWLSVSVMQKIAMENNLSETAFLVPAGANTFAIRWFSPLTEIAFCGHATLASAYVLFSRQPGLTKLIFTAQKIGRMQITLSPKGKIQMDFPNTRPTKVERCPEALFDALSIPPAEVFQNSQAYFAVYPSEKEILNVTANSDLLKTLAPLDVVVTARYSGTDYDFISRYFWPANGGDEDPVTGSIHTGLAPFWAERLEKNTLVAYQASARGGILECEVCEERVTISGNAVPYLSGTIRL